MTNESSVTFSNIELHFLYVVLTLAGKEKYNDLIIYSDYLEKIHKIVNNYEKRRNVKKEEITICTQNLRKIFREYEKIKNTICKKSSKMGQRQHLLIKQINESQEGINTLEILLSKMHESKVEIKLNTKSLSNVLEDNISFFFGKCKKIDKLIGKDDMQMYIRICKKLNTNN